MVFLWLCGIRFASLNTKGVWVSVNRKRLIQPFNINWHAVFWWMNLPSRFKPWMLSICARLPCSNVLAKSSDSLVWRNVLRCKQFLRQGLRWKLGKGDKILFSLDNWLDGRSLLELLNWPIDLVSNPDVKVNEFITPHRKWDVDKLIQVIPNSTIIQQICGMDIP